MKVFVGCSFNGAICAAFALTLCACGGGSGYGNDNSAPEADGGPDQITRSQSEVLLDGADSEDPDGAIVNFEWNAVGGPDQARVQRSLITETPATVKFPVPRVFKETTWVFELAVTDVNGAVGTDTVSVTAMPPPDPKHFLTFRDANNMFRAPSFNVVAGTTVTNDPAALGISALAGDVNFDVKVRTVIRYPRLDDPTGESTGELVLATEPIRTGTFLQRAGSTAITAASNEGCFAFNNPVFAYDIPGFDVDQLVERESDGSEVPFSRVNEGRRDEIEVDAIVSLLGATVDSALCVLVNDQGQTDGDVVRKGKGIAAGFDASLRVPLQDLLAQAGLENRATAEAYYRAIDPNGEDILKDTLSEWLLDNGFTGNTASFADGGPAEATYINGFDLGFGRHMFVRKAPSGDVAAYVINHPNLDTAVDGNAAFATVAMEYSLGPNGVDRFTKFYTFVLNPVTGEQERVLSFDFDGRGEKYQPGTCISCHGGSVRDLDNPARVLIPTDGNIGASFLPWDVDTLYFSDEQFENENQSLPPKPGFSLAEQAGAFRNFNEAVLATDPTPAVRTLIKGWYGDDNFATNTLPVGATFDPNFVPRAWKPGINNNPESADELYLQVVGPTCRACHSVQTQTVRFVPRFGSYASFNDLETTIEQRVFDEGGMPFARLTMDNLWTLPARSNGAAAIQTLANHFGVVLENPGPSERVRRPGIPQAITPSSQVSTEPGVGIRLDGTGSLFADVFKWSLPANDQAVLVGATTAEPGFFSDIPGTYPVRLVVSSAGGRRSGATVNVTVAVTSTESFEALSNEIFAPSPDGTACISCHKVGGIGEVSGLTFVSGDIAGNYTEVTTEISVSRPPETRVDPADPTNSLILQKPSLDSVTHVGSLQPGFDLSGNRSSYDRVLQWIREGANNN